MDFPTNIHWSISLADKETDKKRTYSDISVDLILSSDGVCSKQVDELGRGEGSILHARENLVSGVGWLGDKSIRRGLRVVRTASQELEARATQAVGGTDGTSELDARKEIWDMRRRNRVLDRERTSHRKRPDALQQRG